MSDKIFNINTPWQGEKMPEPMHEAIQREFSIQLKDSYLRGYDDLYSLMMASPDLNQSQKQHIKALRDRTHADYTAVYERITPQ